MSTNPPPPSPPPHPPPHLPSTPSSHRRPGAVHCCHSAAYQRLVCELLDRNQRLPTSSILMMRSDITYRPSISLTSSHCGVLDLHHFVRYSLEQYVCSFPSPFSGYFHHLPLPHRHNPSILPIPASSPTSPLLRHWSHPTRLPMRNPRLIRRWSHLVTPPGTYR